MTHRTSSDLLLLLSDIETRSRNNAVGIPQQQESRHFWEGILCQIARTHIVAPLEEVKEILNFTPSITRVPSTQGWLLGIANVRGTLLPIIDLQQFLGEDPIILGRRTRVLVIDQDGLNAGLLVESVQGMRHIDSDEVSPSIEVEGEMKAFVDTGCSIDGEVLPVFKMSRLAESSAFQMASV